MSERPATLYNDWRDHLVVSSDHTYGTLRHRVFEHLPTRSGYRVSAQNSPTHYVTGRWHAEFNWDALDDFEVAIIAPRWDSRLVPLDRRAPPLVARALAAAGIVPRDETVAGYVTPEEVAALLDALGGYGLPDWVICPRPCPADSTEHCCGVLFRGRAQCAHCRRWMPLSEAIPYEEDL